MSRMPAPIQEQDLFHSDFQADPRDWQAVRLLCDELEAEMAERRRHLLRRLCDWLTLLNVFRAIEERKIVLAHPSVRDIEFHRALITSILGTGELLLIDLREHTKVDPELVGVSFVDFEAHVIQLRYDLRMRHGDMTDAGRANIMKDVFRIP